jgi:hypothetical protein
MTGLLGSVGTRLPVGQVWISRRQSPAGFAQRVWQMLQLLAFEPLWVLAWQDCARRLAFWAYWAMT